MSTLRYLTDAYPVVEFRNEPVPRDGYGHAPGQGPDGYGTKISTDYAAYVKIGTTRHQRCRVYCTQISNAGSWWVALRGKKLFLRDGDIPDDVRQA